MTENKKADWIIVGLGNPGPKYAGTRHNIGWLTADGFAAKHNSEFREVRDICLLSEIKYKRQSVVLAKPTTYMNDSGRAVKYLCRKFSCKPENVIVIVDEYNFPVGKIHVKNSGSNGGHNGTASIIEDLGTEAFIRMRCGIGKDFPPGGMVDYVLENFPASQQEDVRAMIEKSCTALEHIMMTNLTTAMSDINSGRLWIEKEEKKG